MPKFERKKDRFFHHLKASPLKPPSNDKANNDKVVIPQYFLDDIKKNPKIQLEDEVPKPDENDIKEKGTLVEDKTTNKKEALLGHGQMKKKDKKRMKRESFLRKIEIQNIAEIEAKQKKKQEKIEKYGRVKKEQQATKTPEPILNLSTLTQSLHEVEEIMGEEEKKKKKNPQDPKKKTKVLTVKEKKKLPIIEQKHMKAVLNLQQFKDNPLATIKEHITNVLTLESRQKGNNNKSKSKLKNKNKKPQNNKATNGKPSTPSKSTPQKGISVSKKSNSSPSSSKTGKAKIPLKSGKAVFKKSSKQKKTKK